MLDYIPGRDFLTNDTITITDQVTGEQLVVNNCRVRKQENFSPVTYGMEISAMYQIWIFAKRSANFEQALQFCLNNAKVSFTDEYGNVTNVRIAQVDKPKNRNFINHIKVVCI